MKMSNAEYSQYVDSLAPKSKTWKNMFNAFWTGGLICTLGQLLMNGFKAMELDQQTACMATGICLILLSALLTGFAVYDDIAKLAGAGTLVPITGFANSIVAPAVEFKTDESDIIYPSQTNLHNFRGEYDLVQNKIGRRCGNYSKLTNKLKLPHEGSDE